MGARRATSPAYSLVSLIQTGTQYVRTVSLLPELRSTPTRSPGVQPKFCCAKAAVVGSRYIVELCSGSLLRRFLRSKTSNAESSLWLTTHGTPAQNVSPSVRYPTVSEDNLIKHRRTRVYHGKPIRQIPRGDFDRDAIFTHNDTTALQTVHYPVELNSRLSTCSLVYVGNG